jgi:hypothetical protein
MTIREIIKGKHALHPDKIPDITSVPVKENYLIGILAKIL